MEVVERISRSASGDYSYVSSVFYAYSVIQSLFWCGSFCLFVIVCVVFVLLSVYMCGKAMCVAQTKH